jgi:NAD/NADP transhydrogenase beta subunit
MTDQPNDSLRRARALATLLDDAIRIPGTSVRFGIDPIVGLVPGLGDLLGGAASIYIILEAARAGASSSVLLRMSINVGIDTVVGSLPVLGDLFDFAWKSNTRNVRLLSRHLEAPAQTRRASTALVVILIAAIVAVVVGVSALTIFILRRIFS